MGEKRKRLRQMDAGHLPVPRGSIFAGRCERATAKGAPGGAPLWKLRDRLQISQPQIAQIRHDRSRGASDVAESIATVVAIIGRVRHFTHAKAVQHDPDHPFEHVSYYRHE